MQSYPHKILTGRRDKMHTMRQTNGLSGFTKRSESEYDCFGTGHSSTTISAGLGNSSVCYFRFRFQLIIDFSINIILNSEDGMESIQFSL